MAVYSSTTDDEYMEKLDECLKAAIDDFQPEFLIYNAGTDCLLGDPLGRLGITADGIVRRDEMVFDYCLQKSGYVIPVLMIMSGGYQITNAEIIADSITNLIQKFQLTNESKIKGNKYRF